MDSENDVNKTKVEVLGTEIQVRECACVLREIMKVSSHGRHPKLNEAAKLVLNVLEEGGFVSLYEPNLQLILPDFSQPPLTQAPTEPFDLTLG